MNSSIIQALRDARQSGRKLLAVLLDPDKPNNLTEVLMHCNASEVDFLLAGGSLLTGGNLEQMLELVNSNTNIPVIIFPGNALQVSSQADAIFLLSLISGRNPEFLIGNHIIAAPSIIQSGIEVIPTGYMLVDGGKYTTASYMSGTMPLPADKPDVAATVASAGWLLGLQCIYMDAGSGAERPVSAAMIKAVSHSVPLPLVVGGGIKSRHDAAAAWDAGATMVITGTGVERSVSFIQELAAARKSLQTV